jgi:hypothetical protein
MIQQPQSIEFKLIAAVESERFEDLPALLAEYSAHVANMDVPPQKQINDLMEWLHRTVSASRAHALDQFQILSDSRSYSSSDPDRKTWQVTL